MLSNDSPKVISFILVSLNLVEFNVNEVNDVRSNFLSRTRVPYTVISFGQLLIVNVFNSVLIAISLVTSLNFNVTVHLASAPSVLKSDIRYSSVLEAVILEYSQ